ncbi:D-2-hydroxyacid dehydrogenase [Colwellia sp. MSW7]|uniref:D-2-hydroxyacid dehydrogenase n=1 Tax=Colwellia maritima TaxID=2912588 RepID=A0ABS9X4V9_9GAMM|nr:D-2-hydroxyacid dehydrogenase [Colwellia maritima]MCI2285268.1 D-2-hydroxyacid dehydrogenase [Colwellia maritima]
MKILMWIDNKFMDKAANIKLHEYLGNKEVLITTDINIVLENAADIDIVLGDFPREQLASLPKLLWFQQFGTGVEWLSNHPYLVKAPFLLTNCSDDHHDVVADHLMALVLSITRSIPQFVTGRRKNQWLQTSLTDCDNLFQLRGKTVLVVGLGSVGLAIINRLLPFGVNIIGVRKNISKSVKNVSKLYSIDELGIAAQQANIVITCLPRTDETTHLFNDAFFEAMPKPGFFFNIGRGNAVDETALVNALTTGKLNGAAIDVTIEEPLNNESPLWTAPNLLITPHVGGTYNDVMKTWRDVALDNLVLYQQGAQLRNVVDKQLGY